MKNKKNYLENVALKNPQIMWTCSQEGLVTLSRENKGIINRVAQLLLRKPKISYIHLDEFGSFVWQCIDGESDITAIGAKVKQHFGKNVEPIYERLSKYFQLLFNCGFITYKNV